MVRFSARPLCAHLLAAVSGLAVAPGCAATLTVGPGQEYATLAGAIAASADGDTILVRAGTYLNDFAEIRTKVTLSAVGGRVVLRGTENLPNQKGILITDTDVSITGFTFTGARTTRAAGQNGAGIRYQGGVLVLNRCYFHDNQDGMLADPDAGGSITITHSEFAHNGDAIGPGSGYTHNLYVNAVGRLDIEDSYFHDAIVGHEIKSRALVTVINHTRVADGPKGTASYSIDLPNGGQASIAGSWIEQGKLSQNSIIMSFGEEGGVYAGSALSLKNTLIENDLVGSPLGVWNATTIVAELDATQIYGLTKAQVISGPGTQTGTLFLDTEPLISTKHPF
jgi:hypothetical protein